MEPKLKFFYVNFFEINIRHCFTSHGLHLNKAGKELLANDLAFLVLSLFEDPSVSPVNYGCHSDQMSKTSDSSNDSEVPLNLARKDLLTNSSSIHIKKTPVTRPDNFLWEN